MVDSRLEIHLYAATCPTLALHKIAFEMIVKGVHTRTIRMDAQIALQLLLPLLRQRPRLRYKVRSSQSEYREEGNVPSSSKASQ